MNWLILIGMVASGAMILMCVAGIIHCTLALKRNDEVCAFRTALVNKIADASERDGALGKDSSWRWAVYDSVTYEEMLRQRRRPLSDFYLDYSFTE